jgi:hypothetical protein
MDAMNRNGLTPAEQEELESLSRERTPSRLLEERTVRALKERGLIRSSLVRTGVVRPWMAIAAVAASVALFASGLTLGQWMGARQTVDALTAFYPDQTERAAALVQSTGSAHTAALNGLIEATEQADAATLQQARDVARAALWSAASEVVRMAPDDPLAVRILQEFERARSGQGTSEDSRNFVWF